MIAIKKLLTVTALVALSACSKLPTDQAPGSDTSTTGTTTSSHAPAKKSGWASNASGTVEERFDPLVDAAGAQPVVLVIPSHEVGAEEPDFGFYTSAPGANAFWYLDSGAPASNEDTVEMPYKQLDKEQVAGLVHKAKADALRIVLAATTF